METDELHIDRLRRAELESVRNFFGLAQKCWKSAAETVFSGILASWGMSYFLLVPFVLFVSLW